MSSWNQRRRKVRMSCDFCTNSKLKCSQDRPACQRCVGRGQAQDCTYSEIRRPGRRRLNSTYTYSDRINHTQACSGSKGPQIAGQDAPILYLPTPGGSTILQPNEDHNIYDFGLSEPLHFRADQHMHVPPTVEDNLTTELFDDLISQSASLIQSTGQDRGTVQCLEQSDDIVQSVNSRNIGIAETRLSGHLPCDNISHASYSRGSLHSSIESGPGCATNSTGTTGCLEATLAPDLPLSFWPGANSWVVNVDRSSCNCASILDRLSRISACIEYEPQYKTMPIDAILAADQNIFVSKAALLECVERGPCPHTGLVICSNLILLLDNLKEHAERGNLIPPRFSPSALTVHNEASKSTRLGPNRNGFGRPTALSSLPALSSGIAELPETVARRCALALLKWRLHRHIQVSKELSGMQDVSAMHRTLVFAAQELNRKAQELLGMISLSCRAGFG